MHRTSHALIMSLALASVATADEATLERGDRLPQLEATYLTGERALLPQDVAGRPALLLFGFSYASRKPVEAWAESLRKVRIDTIAPIYELPMIGGMSRLARPFIDRGMRRGTPRALHGSVATFYGDTRPWRERLGVEDTDVAYLVLLDAEARVAWRHAGWPDAAALEALRARLAPRPDAGGGSAEGAGVR